MSYDKFFNMLNKVPRLVDLWDKEKEEMNIPLFEKELNVMSSGEVQMAKFFAAVWLGDNTKYGFDLVDAVGRIDPRETNLIMNWMRAPFWP
jgi:hypothetical protein